MLDFNDSNAPPAATNQASERDEIRAALLPRLESVLFALYPAGKAIHGKFVVGDVLGSPGRSLEIALDGEKAGLWIDRATGQGGDIFDLLAAHRGIDAHSGFALVITFARELLGRAPAELPRRRRKEAPIDELGPATAKWDYLDPDGALIACVYRYDPPGQKKQFRPWDAKRRKMSPPDPRPLYNQPGIARADTVVLVEGEKCAQALIEAGVCATTAMHGANAPIDKTDWSPLRGKTVLIWPDRDKTGWDYAMNAAEALLAAGAVACFVLIPPAKRTEDHPEGCPDGWDAADAMAEGFDVQGFLAAGERIAFHPQALDEGTDEPVEQAVWATEDALALTFTGRYAPDWRFVALWGKWVVWTGSRWQTEQTLAAQHLMRQVCREAALKADSHRMAVKLASSGTVAGVERLARCDRRHAATAEEWDADPWLLNTPAGVVDLRTGRMRAHDRADHMTKIAAAAMSPGTPANCPTWRKFLAEITGNDLDLQAYLARVAGYALTGITSEHALFFLYGTSYHPGYHPHRSTPVTGPPRAQLAAGFCMPMTETLRVEYRKVETLVPFARNPRTHSEAQVAKIAASIVEFGWTNPILVDGGQGIIAGHGRLAAARKLGLTEVPVIELAHLTTAQKRAYVIADNRLALDAGWDEEMLALELAELSEAGYDLALTGFADDEIDALLADAEEGSVEESQTDGDDDDADEVPETPANPVSRPGDVWQLGAHRLICGDATDPAVVAALMAGEAAALCFTSPPYGNQRDYTNTIIDWDALMRGVFAQLPMAADGQVLVNLGLIHREQEVIPYWDGWLDWMRAQGWRRFAWYVWDQGPGLPGDWNGRLAPAFEFVFHFNRKGAEPRRPNKNIPCIYAGRDTHLRGDGTSAGGMRNKDGSKTAWNHVGQVTQETKIPDAVIRIMRHKGKIGQGIDHPAVFPVALPRFVLESYSDEDEIVFEPFCGSGTTLLAAQRSGRMARATEIAPEYVDVAVKRFRQNFPEVPVTLAATGQTFDAVAAERGISSGSAPVGTRRGPP